jgi:hypothetical protein
MRRAYSSDRVLAGGGGWCGEPSGLPLWPPHRSDTTAKRRCSGWGRAVRFQSRDERKGRRRVRERQASVRAATHQKGPASWPETAGRDGPSPCGALVGVLDWEGILVAPILMGTTGCI